MNFPKEFLQDSDTLVRQLACHSVTLGHTTREDGMETVRGGKDTRSIQLQFGACYFPKIGTVMVFWVLVKSGGMAIELGKAARAEFIEWNGGLPVYRRVEEYLVEARRWAVELLHSMIGADGKLDYNPFTWEPSFQELSFALQAFARAPVEP